MTPADAIAAQLAEWAVALAECSARIGDRVVLDTASVLDRSHDLALSKPGERSANGSCRMVRAADGWIAVNLPRDSDAASVPAWLGDTADDPWEVITKVAAVRSAQQLVDDACLLGLAVAAIGETSAANAGPRLFLHGSPGRPRGVPRVLDLTSLWAGPLCGDLLARMGATVAKVEAHSRPDGIRHGSPALFERLNGRKTHVSLNFAAADDLAWLREQLRTADVVLTSARPRAFDQLGIGPKAAFEANRLLTWVAISGHGWSGGAADRIAFGDDAAAAAGLVDRALDGTPHFHGDAVADPLTGIAAAVATLRALELGGGRLVDAGLAPVAAGIALRLSPAVTRSDSKAW